MNDKMENENKKITTENKEKEIKKEEGQKEEQKDEKKNEEGKKKDEKKETKTEKKKEKPKKTEAVVNEKDSPISTKHSIAICDMIRKRKPGEAMEMLEKVLKKELAVPFKGEIPHRKRSHRIGKGKLGGRYPTKASKVFIKILKNLIANANINGLDIENIIIVSAKANLASRPVKPSRIAYGRKKFKRTHIILTVKEIKGINKKGEKKKK
jgi:ribosomal protein L22